MKRSVIRVVLYLLEDSENFLDLEERKNSLMHIYDDDDDIDLRGVYIDYTSPKISIYDRTEFKHMLCELKKKRIDYIIVYELSHISNDIEKVILCKDFLRKKYGVGIYSVEDDFDSLNHENIYNTTKANSPSMQNVDSKQDSSAPLEVTIPFESKYEMIDLLKYAALYFDRINVRCPMLDEDTKYYRQDIFDQMNMLIEENIVHVEYVSIFDNTNRFSLSDFSSDIFNYATDTFASDNGWNTFELMDTPKINKFLVGTCPDDEPLVKWFMMATNNEFIQNEFQLAEILAALFSGKGAASSYISATKFFNKIARKGNVNINSCSAVESVGLLLPNYKERPLEDVLEIRYKARDELIEMRHYISHLLDGYKSDGPENLSDYVNHKVNADINAFNARIRDGQLGVLQKVVEDLKTPLSLTTLLTPLFTSFFGNISTNISTAIALGLISASTGIEYLRHRNALKNDPMYFRIKLQ